MTTEKNIFQIIKNDEMPYWQLYTINTVYGKQRIGGFDPSDLPKDTDKIEASIRSLENRIALFPHINNFAIEIAKSSKANGSSKMGLIEFVREFSNFNNQNQLNGIAGNNTALDFSQHQTLIEDKYKAMLEASQKQNEINLKAILLERDKEDFKKEKEKYENELKEKKEKFDNNTELLTAAGLNALQGLGRLFGMNTQAIAGIGNIAGNADNNEIELTPREQKISKLAEFIDESDLTENQIQLFLNQLKNPQNVKVSEEKTNKK